MTKKTNPDNLAEIEDKTQKNGPDFIPGRILILIKIPACAGMTIADYFTNAP